MNNPIDLALTYITTEIHPEILDLAFKDREPWEATYPIEEMILNKVIRKRVYKDANIFGGKQKDIILRPSYKEKLELNIDDAYSHTGPFSLYRIPPADREDCPLVEVHGLTYRGNYAGFVPNTQGIAAGGANLASLGQAIIDAQTFASAPPRPNIELLSGDLVRLWPSQHSTIIWIMNCRIAFDKDFTNLNTSAMPTFANLCVAATKMYIYNKLRVPIDKAYIANGMELNEVKSAVDSFQDALQRYNELLDELAGAMVLDPQRLKTLIPYMI